MHLGIVGYVAAILLLATLLLSLSLWAVWRPDVGVGLLVLIALAAFLPATDVATALVNRLTTLSAGAVALPGLALRDGVPPGSRTLVAVPTLLTSQADLLEQIERLEVHHLSGAGGDLAFALLADGLDADREVMESDAATGRRRGRGRRRTESPLRTGARRRAAFLPAAPAPRLQRGRGQVDGLGAQAGQAA